MQVVSHNSGARKLVGFQKAIARQLGDFFYAEHGQVCDSFSCYEEFVWFVHWIGFSGVLDKRIDHHSLKNNLRFSDPTRPSSGWTYAELECCGGTHTIAWPCGDL